MPLVKLLDVSNNAGGARPRSGKVIPVDVPTEVTNEELVELGAFVYEVLDAPSTPPAETPAETVPAQTFPAAKPAEEVKVEDRGSNLPGQSG